ncbi:MAG: hypothetical protein ETSY1_19430 [Candidatus Entotheonella factor]|uniref:PqqD family protein n=1 Tax=Entotheonella factor TaxID=1429438 RepID=W4LK36_ENTF1|nr:PqqD family protein [Candidatus Entotheonella palauensis]ETW98269.1 MAG: hypothetical protein ETSY1_19430 [Candidatus Entotheonella factor]
MTYLQQRQDCVTRQIGDETIIVPVRSHVADLEAIYTLNELGSLIWKLLDGHTNTHQIAATLCESYDVMYSEALQDVHAFLNALEAAGLIVHPTAQGA